MKKRHLRPPFKGDPHLKDAANLAEDIYDSLARDHGRDRRLHAPRSESNRLLAWARVYLPAHFTRPPSLMHNWLGSKLDHLQEHRGSKLNLLGPRGGAKSTIATLAYPLWLAVQQLEPYIWLISDTRHQAYAHLENLKAELVGNPSLEADYPDATGPGPVWRSGAIVLRNGVTIEAFGTGQRLRGRRRQTHRPTLIICDDLQNDSHMQSPLAREHSSTWFHGTLLKAGTSRTNLVNLATALHRDALAMRLHETPGWRSKIFRAIHRWPENMSLWEQWELVYTDLTNPHYLDDARRFYDEHRAEMDAGAVVLWPEEEDLYTLMCMRAESGRTAFEREKQNSPINPDMCEWPETYFDESIWFDTWPADPRLKILALDPSKGSDARRGDYSAFIKLAVDQQGLLYVEADLARRSVPELIATGVELYHQFRPDGFGIESNQFQELLGAEFEAEFQRQGLLAVRPWLLDNHVSKLVRIRRLGPHLSARRVRLKDQSPGTRLLWNQLKDFPLGDHDDGPDALEMAIRLAAQLFGDSSADDGLGSRLPLA